MGDTQNGWFIVENPIKSYVLQWMIWGYPYFRKPPYDVELPQWPGPICSAGRSHHEASSQLQPFLGAIQLFLVFFFGTRGIEDRVSNDSCTVLRELFMASWLDRVIDKGLILTCFNTSTSTGGWSKQFLFVHSLPPCNTWFSILFATCLTQSLTIFDTILKVNVPAVGFIPQVYQLQCWTLRRQWGSSDGWIWSQFDVHVWEGTWKNNIFTMFSRCFHDSHDATWKYHEM